MQNFNSELSERSKTFLADLRVYLFSSAKNSHEIDDIVEQLEVHLIEAEKNGKSIDKIIGYSPKAYMKQLSNEMAIDYATWFKYIPIILISGLSFIISGDLLQGSLSYSLLELLGFLAIAAIFIITVFGAFKFVSGNNLSQRKQMMIFYVVSLLQLSLFVGLIFLNKFIETPMINFGPTGTIIIGSSAFICLIAVSLWSKTAVLLVFLFLLYFPQYVLEKTVLQESTQMIVSWFITLIGIAIYMLITVKRAEKG